MNETLSTSGNVKVSNDVIASIALSAAREIEGILPLGDNIVGGIAKMLGAQSVRGVNVELSDNRVVINMSLGVKYGVRIPEVSLLAQSKVRERVEYMTGLSVIRINVSIVFIEQPVKSDSDRSQGELK